MVLGYVQIYNNYSRNFDHKMNSDLSFKKKITSAGMSLRFSLTEQTIA